MFNPEKIQPDFNKMKKQNPENVDEEEMLFK